MKILVLFKLTKKWPDTWFKADDSLGCNSEKHIEVVHAHFAYMHQLHAENKLESGGPLLKEGNASADKYVNGAMFIYQNSSLDEAKAYAESDPFVIEGVMEVDFIKPFIQGI